MTQARRPDSIWVTQEAYDRLKQELEQIRAEVESNAAAEEAAYVEDGRGTSDERGSVAERQQSLRARMRQIEDLLGRAEVGETPPDDGMVEDGMVVTIRFEGQDEVERFLLGSRELLSLDPRVELDVYSPTSPLGSAIYGKYPGDRVSYRGPNGRTLRVEIVEAKPFVPGSN